MANEGQKIGAYVLEQRLGAGAFGEVWRAHHEQSATKLAAIKIATEPSYIQNLRREGTMLPKLHHPAIVAAEVLDPFADPPYLLMEYVPGINLRTLMQHGPLAPDITVALLGRVLQGIAYAHRQGVIHRDLKPENILIRETGAVPGTDVEVFKTVGMVKITDFGLGRAASIGLASIQYSASLAGNDSRIVGTPDYMAPEQRENPDAVDARADLYACGVMLFEMLTGRRPIGMTLPSELNPATPRRLDDAFRRAWARVEQRFASAEEFMRAITDEPLRKDRFTNSVGMEFVRIAAGEFVMGSPADEPGRFDDEKQHPVRISRPFYMQTTPVTQGQWKAVMQDNPSFFKARWRAMALFRRLPDDLPVERVSSDDAVRFCTRLAGVEDGRFRYRLPTEAEWEYACRAGSTGAYAGSGNVDEMGWHSGNSRQMTHPVATKASNAWGLFDMHGNVWEWCSDVYADYPGRPVVDPQGPDDGASLVLRGGAWDSNPRLCRSALRNRYTEDLRDKNVGFRVVVDAA
ncbi:MAG: bifunctional serine/threonine-protein kinase/formylglycine-generating enzyme family protein [Tepidisphaeraceae bacterium]